jgi:hypothetical protein
MPHGEAPPGGMQPEPGSASREERGHSCAERSDRTNRADFSGGKAIGKALPANQPRKGAHWRAPRAARRFARIPGLHGAAHRRSEAGLECFAAPARSLGGRRSAIGASRGDLRSRSGRLRLPIGKGRDFSSGARPHFFDRRGSARDQGGKMGAGRQAGRPEKEATPADREAAHGMRQMARE